MISSTSRGFTLVEVMIAIAIGGLVTLTVAATAAAVPDFAARADDGIRETLRATVIRTQLREWLRASYVTDDSVHRAAFAGVDGAVPGADALRFRVVDPSPTIRGSATLLLGVQAEGGDSAFVAVITPRHGAARRLVLVHGAAGLEAQYLYFVSGQPRWFAGWSSEVERPAAVRLHVMGSDLHPLLRLPLTVWLRA